MPVVLLHLGDLHIKDADSPVLKHAEPILQSLKAQNLKPTAFLIIVAGDVAFSGTTAQYDLASAFFDELLAGLAKEYPEVEPYVVLVPGNHDCDFTVASDIRSNNAISGLLENIDLRGRFVAEYLSVQAPFFAFVERFGQRQTSSAEQLCHRRTFTAAGQSIALTCYNTAWLSQNPELPGSLFFPASAQPPINQLTADMEVAILHHPYNWLQPSNAQQFRSALEERSDLIITGHEHHHDTFGVYREHASAEYVSGQALHDPQAATNGFNLLTINIATKEWLLQTHTWNGTMYVTSRTSEPRIFSRNTALADRAFTNNASFKEQLSDVGIGFTHARKPLLLHDLFVYPSLRHRQLQRKIDGDNTSRQRISTSQVPSFLIEEPCVLIQGASHSGKSSLARTAYPLLQSRAKLVPILLDGTQLDNAQRLDSLIDQAYIEQYSKRTLQAFQLLPPARRAVIIDDFDSSRLSRKALARVIDELTSKFGKIILFTDEYFELDKVINAKGQSVLLDFRHYHIEEFNRVQRNQLIERWVTIGRNEEDEEGLQREIDAHEKAVDMLLGKQLLPAHPLFILAIMQGLESTRTPTTANGSYGEIFDGLITERLLKVSQKPTDLGTKGTIIARIAYYLHRREAESFTMDEMITVCDHYFNEYGLRIEPHGLLHNLLAAEIIRESLGNYRFRYPYYFHFFTAKYFRDNQQDNDQAMTLQTELEQMADRVYYEAYANILIYYLYLTKDIGIIERLIQNAERIYTNHPPADLETDVDGLNLLYGSMPKPVALPDSDPVTNRQYVRERLDDLDDSNPIRNQGEKVIYADELNDFIKINIALKTVHILGQVLRNYPGVIRRDIKSRIAEQCYLLGLRVLTVVLSLIQQNTDELREYFGRLMRERQPNLTLMELGKSAEEAIITLSEFWAYGIIKTISQAVGMEELTETYKEVLRLHAGKLSIQMIDVTIKLDHCWSFPEKQVDSLHTRVHKNNLAFCVLRHLIANYFYLRRADYNIRQRYTVRLNITVTPAKFLDTATPRS